ncbi:hypothetical protein GCM10023078_15940 [Gibbsiella greigii]
MEILGNDANAVFERLLIAYNVDTQKALAEKLGVHASNVSGWVIRGSIPGSALVKCVLDTGADLQWLVSGELKNLSCPGSVFADAKLKGRSFLDRILTAGGKPIVQRIMDAYGYKMQKELGDRFDLSSGTISSWIRRDFFPADIVIACALETGVSLEWLVTGRGNGTDRIIDTANQQLPSATNLVTIPKYLFVSSILKPDGNWTCERSLIPSSIVNAAFVEGLKNSWLIEKNIEAIGSGRWFVDIDGVVDVYDVARIPGNKLKLSNHSAQFECSVGDINPIGLVIMTFERHM